jgi:DNA-directed RNA polymerase subunit D
MDVEIESENDSRMRFTLKGANVGFANMIRRYAMGAVPLFAIDNITIYENTSSLFDEYIANRIGLVPIKMASGYKPGDEVIFTLDAHGPGTVYSGELKSVADKIRVAYDKIPLLELLEEQNLRLEAKARMGLGRQHAKWQAGLGAYEIGKDGQFNFMVESFQQMSPRDMMVKAAEELESRCGQFEDELGRIAKEAKKKKE